MKILKALTFGAWPILALPFAMEWIGSMMNQAAVYANGMKMPVVAIEGCSDLVRDPVHVCMTSSSHLKILSDILISSQGVSSFGDWILEWSSTVGHMVIPIWIALLVYCAITKKSMCIE